MNEDYRRGQWDAFNRVLNLINTFDKNMVDKTSLYAKVMEMIPKEKKESLDEST